MPTYAKREIDDALAHYQAMAKKSHESGDWTIFPQVFTEDAIYIDHCFGTMRGRQAITDWLVRCQEPFPSDMVFPLGWKMFDYDAGVVVMEVFNRLIIPEKPDLHFDLINWTRLTYGGNGMWRIEEDIYNSVRMREVFDQWMAAGGRPRATLMAMQHGEQ